MRDALIKLLKIRSILSLVCAALLVYCTVSRIIDGKDSLTIIVMVFTFFFTKKDGSENE